MLITVFSFNPLFVIFLIINKINNDFKSVEYILIKKNSEADVAEV